MIVQQHYSDEVVTGLAGVKVRCFASIYLSLDGLFFVLLLFSFYCIAIIHLFSSSNFLFLYLSISSSLKLFSLITASSSILWLSFNWLFWFYFYKSSSFLLCEFWIFLWFPSSVDSFFLTIIEENFCYYFWGFTCSGFLVFISISGIDSYEHIDDWCDKF